MDSNGQIYPERPEFHVIDGGLVDIPRLGGGFFGGGGGKDVKPWLLEMKKDQMFLAAPKATAQIGLHSYQVIGFSPEGKAAYLFVNGENMWVDVGRFSATHKLVEKFPHGDESPE